MKTGFVGIRLFVIELHDLLQIRQSSVWTRCLKQELTHAVKQRQTVRISFQSFLVQFVRSGSVALDFHGFRFCQRQIFPFVLIVHGGNEGVNFGEILFLLHDSNKPQSGVNVFRIKLYGSLQSFIGFVQFAGFKSDLPQPELFQGIVAVASNAFCRFKRVVNIASCSFNGHLQTV